MDGRNELPHREAFENLAKQEKRRHEDLKEEARLDALVEDVLRNAIVEDFKTLKLIEETDRLGVAQTQAYEGEIAGHNIRVERVVSRMAFQVPDEHNPPVSEYRVKIDDLAGSYRRFGGEYGNVIIKEFFEKVAGAHT